MPPWTAFPHDARGHDHDDAALRSLWPSLHVADVEPWPDDPAVRQAWRAFHAGRFEAAFEAGQAAGDAGANVADRAQMAQAHYVEPSEAVRARFFDAVVERAAARVARRPTDAQAHHLYAAAQGRRLQGTPIGRALAQGTLARVRVGFETAIALAPTHAHAHIALGCFHAEVIDQLGALVGRTQSVSKDQALALLRNALRLDPDSVRARLALANALLMLEGEQRMAEATRLYHEAAELPPRDAIEGLETGVARQALGDDAAAATP